jgi:hypothetical protein
MRTSNIHPRDFRLDFDAADSSDRLRLVVKPVDEQADGQPALAALQANLVEGSSCWTLPSGTTRSTALTVWSPELKDALYASIRMRGNRLRCTAATQFLDECTKLNQFGNPDRLQGWASTLSALFFNLTGICLMLPSRDG